MKVIVPALAVLFLIAALAYGSIYRAKTDVMVAKSQALRAAQLTGVGQYIIETGDLQKPVVVPDNQILEDGDVVCYHIEGERVK